MHSGHRSGVTLLEVLITIFILAIGLLALLVLFPLGALEMGRALKDDRCASACALADGIALAQNVRGDSFVLSDATVVNSFTNPFSMMTPTATPPMNPASGTLSYGVYVDPWGFIVDAPGTATGEVLGALSNGATVVTPGIRRRSITLMNYTNRPGTTPPGTSPPGTVARLSTQECYRWCTLLDDIYFKQGGPSNDGTPDLTTGSVQRGCRYTWAWLVRQVQVGSPTTPVQLTVIVYQDRDTSTAPGDKTTYEVAQDGSPGSNVVTITYPSGTPPPMKVGRWVLDTTQWNVPPYASAPNNGPVPGYFYRVVNYADLGADPNTAGNNLMQLELQTPLKNPDGVPAKAITIMESVSEVFDRGT